MTRTRAVALTIATAVCAASLSAVALVADPEPARAAFPGKNGKVAFEMRGCYRCGPDAPVAGELYAVGPDGRGMTRLTNTDAWESEPAFSPDGKRIAFARRENYRHDSAQLGIYVSRSDGSGERKVAESGSSPDWSPSGKRIAFVDGGDVYSVGADGTNPQRLTEGGGEEPSWSPDGKRIAFEADRDGQDTGDPDRDEDADVYTMRADGSGERKIVDVPLGRRGLGGDPDWSPDGKRIAFVDAGTDVPDSYGPPSSYYSTEVFTVAPDGTRKRQVTDLPNVAGGLIQPAWSPDGKKIAALRRPTSGPGGYLYTSVHIAHVDSTDTSQLTPSGLSLGPPDWQPLPKSRRR